MRPAPQRLEDLRRQLADAKSELTEARAVEAVGTSQTAADLANAEQIGICLAAEVASAARGERVLEDMIREAELRLAGLRGALSKAVAEQATLLETAGVTGERIVRLKVTLEEERGKVAPLIDRRAKDVERLERRIALVEAHQAARVALKPTKQRVVLGFPQVDETAAPAGASS